LRRAKAFAKVLTGMTIFIDDNLIVGTLTKYRGGVQPYPEFSCDWMTEETDFYGPLGKITVTRKDKKVLMDSVEYWRDRCVARRVDEVWLRRHPKGPSRADLTSAGVFMDIAEELQGRINLDYGKVMRIGLNGIIDQAKEELAKLPSETLEALKKRDFLDAVIISCEAVISFANRYANLANHMASEEDRRDRKLELREIAEICRQVPAKPVRTFREAIQSFWFIHVTALNFNCASGITPGRFGLYTNTYYQGDKMAGRITEEEALELIELLFIKFTEISKFAFKKHTARSQGTMFQNISLGGVDWNGYDATNEVDYLLLEAQRRIRTIQPTLSVLYHDKMNLEFLLKAAELVATGIGMPAFFNSDLNTERLLDHGSSLEDARNHCIIGCIEGGFSHCAGSMRSGFFNMPKMLELALNNGRDPFTGLNVGLKTGRAITFHTYQQLHNAVRKQLAYAVSLYNEARELGRAVIAEYVPVPFFSALVDDCIANCQDESNGGARYYMNGGSPVGTVDLADSLVAVCKVVFEEKRYSMLELLDALKNDFEGYEALHQSLLRAPKYGNDDESTDAFVRQWYDYFYEEHQKYKDYLGKNMRPAAISIAAHFPFGVSCGALPNGRKAKFPLTDATVSPEPGKDTLGPTALLRSATRVIDTIRYASGQLNMKFHPSDLADQIGKTNLIALIKSYTDLGGHHVQFNVVSAETLRDAQKHPDKYRNLIVRVAGFSAFFVHLDTEVQNEIVRRTELRFT
jgi:formate C-acetyltransferase